MLNILYMMIRQINSKIPFIKIIMEKNKNKLIISDNYNSLDKVTIYYSKCKIKQESVNIYYNYNWEAIRYLNEQKSYDKILQRGC